MNILFCVIGPITDANFLGAIVSTMYNDLKLHDDVIK